MKSNEKKFLKRGLKILAFLNIPFLSQRRNFFLATVSKFCGSGIGGMQLFLSPIFKGSVSPDFLSSFFHDLNPSWPLTDTQNNIIVFGFNFAEIFDHKVRNFRLRSVFLFNGPALSD